MATPASAAISSSTSRSWAVNVPTRLLRTWMTPVTVPRKRIGTHTIERVREPVAASTRRATRGSVAASLTTIGSPVAATVPAIPSPTATVIWRSTPVATPPSATSQCRASRRSSSSMTELSSAPSACSASATSLASSVGSSRSEPSTRLVSTTRSSRARWRAATSGSFTVATPRV